MMPVGGGGNDSLTVQDARHFSAYAHVPMHHYILRAECESDIDAFADAVRDAALEVRDWTTFKEPGIPDTFLRFHTDATLEVLLPILEAIPDGHVMCETIGFAGGLSGHLRRDVDA